MSVNVCTYVWVHVFSPFRNRSFPSLTPNSPCRVRSSLCVSFCSEFSPHHPLFYQLVSLWLCIASMLELIPSLHIQCAAYICLFTNTTVPDRNCFSSISLSFSCRSVSSLKASLSFPQPPPSSVWMLPKSKNGTRYLLTASVLMMIESVSCSNITYTDCVAMPSGQFWFWPKCCRLNKSLVIVFTTVCFARHASINPVESTLFARALLWTCCWRGPGKEIAGCRIAKPA